MNAIWYEALGSAATVLHYGELETPTPAAGQVLIKLHASSVNPSDVKMRAGTRAGGTKMAYPKIIPHSDGAGVIAEVGLGVDTNRIGQRVWLTNGQWNRAFGTAAEYIAIDEALVAPLPDNTSFDTGASLGIPAITASHSVYSNGDVRGKTIFISGGAGTVGYLAVQLATLGGAHVITTARGEEAIKRASTAGADHVFDFTDPGLADKVLAANNNQLVDRIIEVEFGSNVETHSNIIKPRGNIVTFGSAKSMKPALPFYSLMFKGVTIEFLLMYLLSNQERQDAFERINSALQDDELHIPIHSTYPLSETVKAHEQVENGRNGSVLLTIA
ncbi:MAG: NADPH:quinone reductase [Agarilytica sp.]